MKSLGMRLTVMMLVICALGMGLITTMSTVLSRNFLLDEAFGKLSQNTATEAQRINGWLENQAAYIKALALDLSYRDSFERADLLPQLGSHVEHNGHYFDVYLGRPDGEAIFSSGFIPDYASGWAATKRPWYVGAMGQAGTPFITAPYTDVQTGSLCITTAMTVSQRGGIVGVAAADILIDQLNEIVMQANVGEKSYAFLVDREGHILIHPNAAYGPDDDDVFQSLSKIEQGVYAGLWQATANTSETVKVRGADGVDRYYTAHAIPQTGWRFYTAIPVAVVEAPMYSMLVAFAVVLVLVLLTASGLIFFAIRRTVVRPIGRLTAAAGQLAEGSTDIHIEHVDQDEIGLLIASFTHMADSIRRQVEITALIAGGDLTVQVPLRSDQDVMGRALQQLQKNLAYFIGDISLAAGRVSAGSNQISENSQSLAQGSTEQASTVEELADAIADISNRINTNTAKTRATSEISSRIAHSAETSTGQLNAMIRAVQQINDASADISKVIKTIEDIAFQTNILALNAAVEAARAGQHGKGFAVVADEVRNLASKSAQAARETTALIENSIQKAVEGTKIAEKTSSTLQAIIEEITHTATLTEEVSAATAEQAEAITQVNEKIELVSQVISDNAAISEECAAAATELSAEAVKLDKHVLQFRIDSAKVGEVPQARPDHQAMTIRPAGSGIAQPVAGRSYPVSAFAGGPAQGLDDKY